MPSVPIRSRAPLLFLLLSLLLFSGCKDSWLRVFFDGVPDSESQEEVGTEPVEPSKTVRPSEKGVGLSATMISQHLDYVEKKCVRCHDTKSATYLTADKKEICFSCHKREKFQGKFIHGPVAVGGCLACHHPHESQIRKLLRSDGSDLCFKCHKPEAITQIANHNKEDFEDCLKCHLSHVSDNRFFLKDSSL